MNRCKKLFFLALLTMLFSCSHSVNSIKKNNLGSLLDPKTEEMSRGTKDIRLLSHQLTPIDYLLKNPDIKGLLVNHYMGTGKTYLGTGFAQAYPDRPVIVLAPKFLESNWLLSIDNYGLINPDRVTFVSYDEAPEKLTHADLSQHIILADEVHNLIKYMKSMDTVANEKYTKVYMNIRKAYKILGLTGTPIYSDESDLAFLINLVSGEDLMPFNQESFRLKYTRVLPARQFFRGYLLESELMNITFGMTASFFLMGLLASPVAGLAFLPFALAPMAINTFILPLESFKLRELDLEKMTPVMNKYISYYKFDESSFKDFPSQKIQTVEVPYSREQYSFFLHLVEGDLPVNYLQRLLKNNNVKQSDDFVDINSSQIHEQVYNSIGGGRDIGNFDFHDGQGALLESPKFLEIYKNLTTHNEQSVLYSNYYETGTKAFAEFLRRQGYAKRFETIHPGLSHREVGKITDDYNKGLVKLILLHPDVTEGISLKGTQYLHILEPIINSTAFEQVVGRTRRFQSHSHLPKDKQCVNVMIYKNTSSGIRDIKLANWYERYRELNYMSRWGVGLYQIDKKHDRKIFNPDELAEIKFKTIEKNLSEMQKILTAQSIENRYP